MNEPRDMTPYINTQLLLDKVNGKTVSTVRLGSELARVHGAEFETTIFSNSRSRFIDSGPFYSKTEEEARSMHAAIKAHEEMHFNIQMALGAHS